MMYEDRIVCDPKILNGKPVIQGTRIPVELILKLLVQGMTNEEILAEYPDLVREDILATFAYAQDSVALEEVRHMQKELER